MTDHATCILQHISWESSHENGDFWFIIDIWFFQFIAKQVNCTLLKNSCTYKMAHYLVWLIMGKKKKKKQKIRWINNFEVNIQFSTQTLLPICIPLEVDSTTSWSNIWYIHCSLPFYPPPTHTHKYTFLLRHHDPLIRKITLDVSGINNYYMYSFSKLSSNKGNFCQSLPPKFSEKHAYCKESKLDLIWKIYFVA